MLDFLYEYEHDQLDGIIKRFNKVFNDEKKHKRLIKNQLSQSKNLKKGCQYLNKIVIIKMDKAENISRNLTGAISFLRKSITYKDKEIEELKKKKKQLVSAQNTNEVQNIKYQSAALVKQSEALKNEKIQIQSKINSRVQSELSRLMTQPNLIPRYVAELQKRKEIKIKESEDMLNVAKIMQQIQGKNLEYQEVGLITKEEQLALTIDRQKYQMEKGFNELNKFLDNLNHEKQKWSLQKERDLLTIDQKSFGVSKQSFQNQISLEKMNLYQQEIDLQFSKEKFDVSRQKEFVNQLQRELQIDRKQALNEIVEKAFDIKKKEFSIDQKSSHNHLKEKERDIIHNQKTGLFNLIQKEFSFQKQKSLFELMQKGFGLEQQQHGIDAAQLDLKQQNFDSYNSLAQAQLNLLKSKLENEKQLAQIEIQRGKDINQNKRKLLDIEEAKQKYTHEIKLSKLTKREIGQFFQGKDQAQTEKILAHKKDILAGFQDKYIFDKPDDIKRSYKALGFEIESPYKDMYSNALSELRNANEQIDYLQRRNLDLLNKDESQ